MIVEFLLNFAKFLINFLFTILPDVPEFDISIMEDLTNYINMIFNHLDLLGFFIDISIFKTMVPLVIIALNFEHIYHFAIWIFSFIKR